MTRSGNRLLEQGFNKAAQGFGRVKGLFTGSERVASELSQARPQRLTEITDELSSGTRQLSRSGKESRSVEDFAEAAQQRIDETSQTVSRVKYDVSRYGDDIAELQSIIGDADTAGMMSRWRQSEVVGMAPKGGRNPIFADNDLLIAAEGGNINALAEIRAGDTYITSSQLNEFLNVNTAAQRKSLKGFLKNENIQVFNGKQAKSVASSADFQNVFKTVAKDQGRGDAALAAFAKATGYEAVTMERRLSNYLIYSRPKLGVPIRRLK